MKLEHPCDVRFRHSALSSGTSDMPMAKGGKEHRSNIIAQRYRWLWRRIKEVLPLLVAASIEATREHTDKGTSIALRKAPRNDVSIVRDEESSENNAKGSDISASLLSGSMALCSD